jgi:hypothetical protein
MAGEARCGWIVARRVTVQDRERNDVTTPGRDVAREQALVGVGYQSGPAVTAKHDPGDRIR